MATFPRPVVSQFVVPFVPNVYAARTVVNGHCAELHKEISSFSHYGTSIRSQYRATNHAHLPKPGGMLNYNSYGKNLFTLTWLGMMVPIICIFTDPQIVTTQYSRS